MEVVDRKEQNQTSVILFRSGNGDEVIPLRGDAQRLLSKLRNNNIFGEKPYSNGSLGHTPISKDIKRGAILLVLVL